MSLFIVSSTYSTIYLSFSISFILFTTMRWKELRKFLNSKFHDEDEIILAVDYNSELPIIIKSNYITNSFTDKLLYIDSSVNTLSNLSDNDPIEFSFNEISTFFK